MKNDDSLPQQPQREEKGLFEKVEIKPGLQVAKIFADNWSKIEETALPSVAIKATPSEKIELRESSFGHYPLMPLDFEYPKDAQGQFLFPLAQINYAEMPPLDGFPDSGFLQIFIADDDVYGLEFTDHQQQKNFRVLFFEEDQVRDHKVDFSFLDGIMSAESMPVYKPHALSFTSQTDYVGMGDVRQRENPKWEMESLIGLYSVDEDDLFEEAYDTFSADGHKIGGYATFAQEDPRIGNPPFDKYILLLQIDTDDEIMWGDAGVANFFIHPDDLAKKDFSKVMYSWDCS